MQEYKKEEKQMFSDLSKIINSTAMNYNVNELDESPDKEFKRILMIVQLNQRKCKYTPKWIKRKHT